MLYLWSEKIIVLVIAFFASAFKLLFHNPAEIISSTAKINYLFTEFMINQIISD